MFSSKTLEEKDKACVVVPPKTGVHNNIALLWSALACSGADPINIALLRSEEFWFTTKRSMICLFCGREYFGLLASPS